MECGSDSATKNGQLVNPFKMRHRSNRAVAIVANGIRLVRPRPSGETKSAVLDKGLGCRTDAPHAQCIFIER